MPVTVCEFESHSAHKKRVFSEMEKTLFLFYSGALNKGINCKNEILVKAKIGISFIGNLILFAKKSKKTRTKNNFSPCFF